MKNIMTIDLEDWFHCLVPDPNRWNDYEDRIVPVTLQLLNIFRDSGTTATFFVLRDIACRHPDLILKIKKHGHEIGCHGSFHKFVYAQSKRQFETDIRESKHIIEEIIDTRVVSYRAPFFSITNKSLWALEVIRDAGFKYDSSIFPVINHRYGIIGARRSPHLIIDGLMELPLATYRMLCFNVPLAGGAYLRILPFWLTRLLFKIRGNDDMPIIFYLHPWELDVDQPKYRRYKPRCIRHYWNLKKTKARLVYLTDKYKFMSIRDFYETKMF